MAEQARMGNLLSTDGAGVVPTLSERAPLEFVESVSASMRPVEAVIRELARSDVPVLLLAEPGAGKRTTARRIHEMLPEPGRRFLQLPCVRLNVEDLRTCADGSTRNGATFYLEEIADLNMQCQAYLQETWLQPAGDGAAGGIRVICGSTRDLEADVRSGKLREDLYYRISGVCLRLPPLRQRREDIPVLLRYFLRQCAQEFKREIPDVSAETLRMFQGYSWPGNLQELQYAASVLVALGDEDVAMGGLRTLLQKADRPAEDSKVSLKAASRAASQEAERHLILKALTRTRWNRRRAARELQISYKALLYKLKRIQCEGYGTS